ncbi:carbohydrate ABC transporter permease [Acutalibacter caecimuris]|uniref:carbohydrate ABC transporter permease n=1 Tax=Acutalibacter caecimuris TaxID=3093657 RepID=UPI002AC99007|nr:carbohydrate ABC transporter permease [Acutalibacter sp. M00118]
MILSKGQKAYQVIINIILILVALVMILPLLLLFMSSITEENTLIVNGYSLFPERFSLYAYEYIASNSATLLRAYGISLFSTVVGTSACLLLSTLMAFPLSLKNLPGHRFLSFFVFFTMLFSGGLVPSYIMWTSWFGIRDTLWAYILPNFLLGAFNIILIRTYMSTSIPYEMYEAAKIDGASYPNIYLRIALPLSKPILVTVGLFAGLGYWNDWTNAQYYISDARLLSVQALLNRMVQDIQALLANSTANSGALMQTPQVSIRMAIAFVAMLPILILYPFLQKYFADGIMLGAVKG